MGDTYALEWAFHDTIYSATNTSRAYMPLNRANSVCAVHCLKGTNILYVCAQDVCASQAPMHCTK